MVSINPSRARPRQCHDEHRARSPALENRMNTVPPTFSICSHAWGDGNRTPWCVTVIPRWIAGESMNLEMAMRILPRRRYRVSPPAGATVPPCTPRWIIGVPPLRSSEIDKDCRVPSLLPATESGRGLDKKFLQWESKEKFSAGGKF